MKIRHGEITCEGTIESVRALEQLINKSGLGTVLHDASKGRNVITGDYTSRSAFSRVYKFQINGEVVKLRLWYDKRINTACVKAAPRHMTKIKRFIPGIGLALWKIAKSGEQERTVPVKEAVKSEEAVVDVLLERQKAKSPA